MGILRRWTDLLVAVAIVCVLLLAVGALAALASPAFPPATAATASAANSVQTQLGVILDGSLSTGIGEWETWEMQKQGLANALLSDCFPKDGSVELTVLQIGGMSSLLEVGPVAINQLNYVAVAGQVLGISRLYGLSPLACGLYRLADVWTAKPLTDTRSPSGNSGAWTLPDAAYGLDLVPAVTTDNLVHQYYGYGVSLPAGTVLDGIEVRLDARRTVGTGRTGVISVELSWDGGLTWTATGYSTGPLTGIQGDYYVGGASDLWGRAWTLAELANLRVRVTSYCRPSGTGLTATRVYLDWIPVTVYYHYPSAFAPEVRQVINIASSGIPDACCDDPASAYLCLDPLQSAINAANYLSTTLQLSAEQDRIMVEAFPIFLLGRTWFRDNIAWPQPAAIVDMTPPEFPTDTGWMRTVNNAFDFQQALFYKLGICRPLTLNIQAEPTSCCLPLQVSFSGSGDGGAEPYSFHWSLGDGSDSTEQNPIHTYTSAGLFTVTLTVTDDCGCVSRLVQSEYITANEPPAASFTANPASGCAPLTVHFTDTSDAGSNPLAGWHWDFGDGLGSSSDANPAYTYDCPGTYTVTLTVTDTHGCSDSTETLVSALACLAIQKTDLQDPVPATWYVRYNIRLTNNGPVAINTIQISDTLPQGMYFVFVPENQGWTRNNGVATRLVTSLLPGASVNLALTAGTNSTTRGTLTNNVVAQWGCTVVSAQQATTITGPREEPAPTPGGVLVIQEGTFGHEEDTYMYRYAPDSSYFLASQLKVGQKQQYAALLRFDLSPVPAGATIDRAELAVFAEGWSGMNMVIGAYAVTQDVQLIETTWTDAHATAHWQVGGANGAADRRQNPETTILTHGPRQWHTFDLTSLVQEWVGGTLANNGVLLRAEHNFPRMFHFTSAEGSTVPLRPKLVITYH